MTVSSISNNVRRFLPASLFILGATSYLTAQIELSAKEVARKSLPAVVLILCAQASGGEVEQGSGFFIEPGVVVTNYHVIEGMSRGVIQVAMSERKEKRTFRIARIIGFDKEADLALLSVPSAVGVGIPNLSLVRQDYKIEIGETVFALGNPEGLVGTMTQGLVSASVRSTLKKARIQISAAISHGSSGGPVVNERGHVIGVAVGSLREGQNLNFAVPASLVYTLVLGSEFPTEMQNLLDKNAESDPSRPRSWELPVALGTGRRNSIGYTAAAITNEKAREPKTAEEFVERATRYAKENRIKDAMTDLSLAIRLNPRHVGAFINRGLLYGWMGQVAREIADYNKAIQINPKLAFTYLNRGTAYGKQKKTALELADYSKAIELDPNLLLAYYYRAQIYSEQNKKTLALTDLDNMLRIDPKYHDAYIRRGNLYRDLDKKYLAIAEYTTAIRIDPASWLGYYNRGATLMSIKEYERAITDLSNAILINPKYASAYSSRSYCYCMTGQKDLSTQDFNRAMELGALAALICK